MIHITTVISFPAWIFCAKSWGMVKMMTSIHWERCCPCPASPGTCVGFELTSWIPKNHLETHVRCFSPDVFLDGCAPSKSKVDPRFTITLFFLFANLHLTDTSFATSNILGSSDLVILVGIGMRGIDLALASRRSSWSWARNVGIHKVGQQTHRKQWWEILKFVVTPLPTRKKKVSCFIRIWISSLLYVTIFFKFAGKEHREDREVIIVQFCCAGPAHKLQSQQGIESLMTIYLGSRRAC